jgi:hypothetical protein
MGVVERVIGERSTVVDEMGNVSASLTDGTVAVYVRHAGITDRGGGGTAGVGGVCILNAELV